MTISTELPSGILRNQEMSYDALRALSFLKSSSAWIYRLPVDKDARPVLERAWTHYSFRICRATPHAFSEWLLAMREKSFRVRERHLRFTTTHFDFLLRKLMSYVDASSHKKVSFETKPKEQQKLVKLPSLKKVRSPIVVPKVVAEDTPKRAPKKQKKKKAKKPKPMEVVESSTPTELSKSVETSKSTITQKRKHVFFDNEGNAKSARCASPPVIEEVATPAALEDSEPELEVTKPVELQQIERVEDASSVATPGTWDTLRDDVACYGYQRVKRAVARSFRLGRSCSCYQFKDACKSSDILHSICGRIAERFDPELLNVHESNKEAYISAVCGIIQRSGILHCQTCCTAVGMGLGIASWVFGFS